MMPRSSRSTGSNSSASSQQPRTRALPPSDVKNGDPNPSASSEKRWWSLLVDPVNCYYGLIVVVLIMTLFGMIMVFSSSSVDLISADQSPFSEVMRQCLFALVGIVVGVIASVIPVKWYSRFAIVLLAAAYVLQAMTVLGFGSAAGGNMGWIVIGGFQFQPAEILKLALCLWLPSVNNVLVKRGVGDIKRFIVPIAGLAIAFLLVLAGRDLGTGLIILLIGVVELFIAGLNLKALVVGLVVVGSGVVTVFVLGNSERLGRIQVLFSGCQGSNQALNECYQTIHGMYALASGGLTGTGLGASREKWNYLPEAQNDFIFAIIGEELGFIGAFAVILGFAIIGWCLIVIAIKHQDAYCRVVMLSIATWIVGQALINVLVVLGLLPVIGLPLPFISAGGTALIMSLAAVGVCVGMARKQKQIALLTWSKVVKRRKKK
jgi:cell division protein FtsW